MSTKVSEHIVWCELSTLQEQVRQIKYRLARETNNLRKQKLEQKLCATQQLRILLKSLQAQNYHTYQIEEYCKSLAI